MKDQSILVEKDPEVICLRPFSEILHFIPEKPP